MLSVQVKRVYDPPAKEDGRRVLVDRLWPRGLTKDRARVDVWLKDLAPSDRLRKRFGHDPARWAEFRRDYAQELRAHSDAVRELNRLARQDKVTLLFGARDPEHNNAVALREYLRRHGR